MPDKFQNKYRIPSARRLTPNPSPQERGARAKNNQSGSKVSPLWGEI